MKFQKRNPDVAVPEAQKNVPKDTPWGHMTYLEYKYRVEFGASEFDTIQSYCAEKGIDWFASCWDTDSVEFIANYNVVAHKVASASITTTELLKKIASQNLPIILSSGMSTLDEVKSAVGLFDRSNLALLHTNSTYPSPVEDLNLRVIQTYQEIFPDLVIGYSGHEVGLATTYAAVVLGASIIERHITLDRSMWGTDQSASIEPQGLRMLVSNIRSIETALGDGEKRVSESELPIRKKLRGD